MAQFFLGQVFCGDDLLLRRYLAIFYFVGAQSNYLKYNKEIFKINSSKMRFRDLPILNFLIISIFPVIFVIFQLSV